MNPDEQAIKAHAQAFDDAAHALIGLQPATTSHGTIWQDPIYTQIRNELDGLTGSQSRGVAESRPPVWIDGLMWLHTVDTTITAWTPHLTEGGTVARLDDLTRHQWAPADTAWLTDATARLRRWHTEAIDLLDLEEERRLDVVAPCPNCGTQTVHRRDTAGDNVRRTALQLTVSGCACLHCGTRWDKQHLGFLAEVLGCQPTAAGKETA